MATVIAKSDIRDADRDAMHALPLAIIPLKTVELRRMRMVKNAQLQSVIESFDDKGRGRKQLPLESLHRVYTEIAAEDVELLQNLTNLYSYDVFGLRVQLRNLGIPVNDEDHLKLSRSKQRDLNAYMKQFTQRLIVEIYGTDDDILEYGDVIALFQHPDIRMAREKLHVMAKRLGVGLAEVPKFLEDYGDIYLSLAYFRECMDSVQPAIENFEHSVREILADSQLRQDAHLVAVSNRLRDKVRNLNKIADDRFNVFSQSTDDMWENLTADKFDRFKSFVETNHTTIGGVLCALNVKMAAWRDAFPEKSIASVEERAEYILGDFREGF